MACSCSAPSLSPRGLVSRDIELLTPLIRHEFEALKLASTSSAQQKDNTIKFATAVHPDNTHKNRYCDILADEETRVKLAPMEHGDEDYINANYIDGEVAGSKRAYILTQAPLPHTFDDFWRMVWQEKAPVIACLTMLRENQRLKAHKYWPEDGHMQQYGKIFVYHKLSLLFKSVVVRLFAIWKEGDSAHPMEVLQLHYQDWPDFGTPASTESIRVMASLLSALKERGRQRSEGMVSGPAVIHCSAGVGRAGTFVATHITLTKLEQLSKECPATISSLSDSPITIKDTVAKLRRQRTGIVQTLDQYTFIYRVVADALLQSEKQLANKLDSAGVRRRCSADIIRHTFLNEGIDAFESALL